MVQQDHNPKLKGSSPYEGILEIQFSYVMVAVHLVGIANECCHCQVLT
jgi:hypothetical protein